MIAQKPIRPFVSNRVGFSIKDGKTYFFDRRHIVVMKGWPAPFAWRRTSRIPWHPTRKYASPLLRDLLGNFRPEVPETPPPLPVEDVEGEALRETPEQIERRAKGIAWAKHVAQSFFANVPVDVRDLLLQFDDRHWNLFSLFARCPGADDLARSNPALCFALASCWVFHKPAPKHPLREARRLVGRKQKEILRWLHFPATESTRRVMARFHAIHLTVFRLMALQRAFQNPSILKTLTHLPALNGTILDIIGAPWYSERVRPSFLHEIAEISPRQEAAYEDNDPLIHLRDTCRMARRLQEPLPAAFESVAHLAGVHNRISAKYQVRAAQDWPLPKTLPPPPFAGTPEIGPLTTPKDVIEEGREMQHCCSSYLDFIAEGYSYLYRVLTPVRATLELRRTATGWKAVQLRGFRNGAIDPAVKKSVIDAVLSSLPQERRII